jgi:hypothetical protein
MIKFFELSTRLVAESNAACKASAKELQGNLMSEIEFLNIKRICANIF